MEYFFSRFVDIVMRNLANLFFFVSSYCFAQESVLIDPRDGQEYDVVEVNGQKWMRDDLNFFTELSYDLNEQERIRFNVPAARWYHLTEIDSVCPTGWRLPTGDEWLAYIKMLAEKDGIRYTEATYRSAYAIWDFHEDINIYGPNNLLSLQVMGIFEGAEFFQYPGSADYWIQDIPMKSEVEKETDIKTVKKTYPNRSHVHFYPNRMNFHSHKHHLNLDDAKTMRRFLVRCVTEN